MTPDTGCADLEFRQSPRLWFTVGGFHLLAAVALLLLRYPSWLFPALLLLILSLSLLAQLRRLRRASGWRLLWRETEGWLFQGDDQGVQPVLCQVEFLSSLLVVIRLGSGQARRLVLTPASGTAEGWRRLHIMARATGGLSGMTDDNVLGGKVDGHQNRVPGNI